MKAEIKKRAGAETTVLREKDGVCLIGYKALDGIPWLINAFSTRLGGVSEGIYGEMNLSFTVGDDPEHVLENHRIVGRMIGVAPEDMVLAAQTHTANVMRVGEEHRGMGLVRERSYTDVDGIMTDAPGLCLVTSYADCVPLYFVDPVHRAIALSHSGWRGTVANIAQNTVTEMHKAFGSSPEELIVCIGPSIAAECYEVGEDVAEAFRNAYPKEEAGRILTAEPGKEGKYLLDLTEANVCNLRKAGVREEHVQKPDLCTACNASWMHSHRASNGKRGGMSAFLCIRP
ncbi:MAG: peptidoglycan editing factor PgeF [Lachnospiraceae bacterium]|nr:peptidoglycan editing factor PgeF [Lachnospiraceae bacterium]